MSEHEFHVEKIPTADGRAVVYRLAGAMGDATHCFEFSDAFLEELEAAPPLIVFQIARLDSMYSAGIGILANCFNKARKAGKQLVLAEVPAPIHRTLSITGVIPMLRVYDSEAEALAAATP